MNFITFYSSFKGKCHDKTCLSPTAIGNDLSLVQLYNLFCNGKPQSCSSGTAGSRRIRAIKFIKDPLQALFRYRISFIFKTDSYLVLLLGSLDQKHTFLPAVCYGISQNIIKNPGKLIRISLDQDLFLCFHLAGQHLLLKYPIEFVCNLFQHHGQINIHLIQFNILQIQLYTFKKLFQKIPQSIRLLQRYLRIFGALLCRHLRMRIQHTQIRHHRSKRCF